ncbi:hypothetical protein L7F22_007476 [Adiantum nelumboides]|nr:hypothetical protein [Adiantum nelumboides]
MAQGKDHIWGGIPLEAAEDESAVDDDVASYLGRKRISLKKIENIQKRRLLRALSTSAAQQDGFTRKEYLDFGFAVCSTCFFCKALIVLLITVLLVVLSILLLIFLPKHHPPLLHHDKYTDALSKALLFFDAQLSGELPSNHTIKYRNNSGLQDGILADGTSVNLAGGFYDSGNHVKFGFPAAFTTTLLSWSVIEYSAKYKDADELSHVKGIIKWSTDYHLKTFNPSDGNIQHIYAQVGEGTLSQSSSVENDGSCWQRPEDMKYPRLVARCTSAPELAGETAAALAAASVIFKTDQHYAASLLQGAENIFTFATNLRKRANYTDSGAPDAASFYPSSGYYDEHVWAAVWLFFATGNWSYFNFAMDEKLINSAHVAYSSGNAYGVFDWDNKLLGAQLLLTRLLILLDPGVPALRTIHEYVNTAMCLYLPSIRKFPVTKGGLVLFKGLNATAPLHYAATAAFLAKLYADYMKAAGIPGWNCGDTFYPYDALTNFSLSQVEYILGKNPERLSYVVGHGSKYPHFVYHRASSIASDGIYYDCKGGFKWKDSPLPNPHILQGALVGGPEVDDIYTDQRRNTAEPTIASNAGLVSALVALAGGSSTSSAWEPIDYNTLFSSLPSA